MKLSDTLRKKIKDREAVVGVMGLGYVGLPLVREFCHAGFNVIGFDVDHKKVSMLQAGKTYIQHLPAKMFKEFIKQGCFHPTTDMGLLKKPDAILIFFILCYLLN